MGLKLRGFHGRLGGIGSRHLQRNINYHIFSLTEGRLFDAGRAKAEGEGEIIIPETVASTQM